MAGLSKRTCGFCVWLFELYIYVSKAVNPIMTPTDMCATKRLHIRQAVRLSLNLKSCTKTCNVDELFIELHFFAPSLNWVHLTHSMKQAFDVLRELRACGLPVHAWP